MDLPSTEGGSWLPMKKPMSSTRAIDMSTSTPNRQMGSTRGGAHSVKRLRMSGFVLPKPKPVAAIPTIPTVSGQGRWPGWQTDCRRGVHGQPDSSTRPHLHHEIGEIGQMTETKGMAGKGLKAAAGR